MYLLFQTARPASKRLVSERPNTKIILPEPHVIDEDEEEAEVKL